MGSAPAGTRMRRSSIEATASGSPACARAVCSDWRRCSASEGAGSELASATVCRKRATCGSSGIEQTPFLRLHSCYVLHKVYATIVALSKNGTMVAGGESGTDWAEG